MLMPFPRYSGADPGFFLEGGALVSCSTSTPIYYWFILFVILFRFPFSLYFFQDDMVKENPFYSERNTLEQTWQWIEEDRLLTISND